MDEVLDVAIDEVALAGRSGCSLDALWAALEGRGKALPDALKPFIWLELRSRPSQVQFTTAALLRPRCGCRSRPNALHWCILHL